MIIFFSFVLSQIGNEEINVGFLGLLMLSHFAIIFSGIAFTIYMIVDCALRKFENEKIIWIVVTVIFNIFGAIVYYYVHGKNQRS